MLRSNHGCSRTSPCIKKDLENQLLVGWRVDHTEPGIVMIACAWILISWGQKSSYSPMQIWLLISLVCALLPIWFLIVISHRAAVQSGVGRHLESVSHESLLRLLKVAWSRIREWFISTVLIVHADNFRCGDDLFSSGRSDQNQLFIILHSDIRCQEDLSNRVYITQVLVVIWFVSVILLCTFQCMQLDLGSSKPSLHLHQDPIHTYRDPGFFIRRYHLSSAHDCYLDPASFNETRIPSWGLVGLLDAKADRIR